MSRWGASRTSRHRSSATAASLTTGAAYGTTLNALAAPASAFCTDETSVLKVTMIDGGERLESVSQEVMLNGANAALLIKANGEPEVIQFRDVRYDVGSNAYSLSGLLRGRRGTDVFMSGPRPRRDVSAP